MAEVATKKSMNVNYDDDDLVLTNNTRNELDSDDKSLQELIESELALRICSNSEHDATADTDEQEEPKAQPEPVKRIVLDAENDLLQPPIDESFSYQNGHVSPETNVKEPIVDQTEAQKSATLPSFQDETNVTEQTELTELTDLTERFIISERGETSCESVAPETATGEFERSKNDEQDGRLSNEKQSGTGVDLLSDILEDARERMDDETTKTVRVESFSTCRLTDQLQTSNIEADSSLLLVDLQNEQLPENLCENDSREFQFSENTRQIVSRSENSQSFVETENVCEMLETESNQIFQHFHESVHEEHLEEFFTSRSVQSHVTTTEMEQHAQQSFDSQRSKESNKCEFDGNLMEEMEENVVEISLESNTEDFEENRCEFSKIVTSSTQDFLETERRALMEESLAMHSEMLENEKQKTKLETGMDLPYDASTCQRTEIQENIENEENLGNIEDNVDEENSSRNPGNTKIPNLSEDIEEATTTHSESNLSIDNMIEKSTIQSSETLLLEGKIERFEKVERMEQLEEIEERHAESKFDSWVTVEQAIERTTEAKEGKRHTEDVEGASRVVDGETKPDESPRAPLATSDDETSDVSNTCDSESREETITTSTVTSSSIKGGTKTKKKKIEGVAGNDASPNLTPRTKKTKKSKKSELEKENISVNSNLQDPSMRTGSHQTHSEIELSDEDDLSNVNVKSLTQNYVSEACRSDHERSCKERIATGVSIKQLCRSFGDISNMTDADQTTALGKSNHTMEGDEKARSMSDLRVCERNYSRFTKDAPVFVGVSVKALRASYCSLASVTGEGKDRKRTFDGSRLEKSSFNKFDALSKKSVLHVRSVDAGKVQQQLNAVGQNGDTNPTCRSCGKVVFQMEQTKAEGLVWHKNCFRCVQCGKQLNVDNYESHESTLYCKPHFKELFQPKPIEESEQPTSDKPDLGLEELSSLNVKSRFQVFEKAGTENTSEIERSPSQIAVKRSPSILSKLAKFQAKGMDIGVADESLNGIPYEESSESEEEVETEETEEVESEIVKAKRTTRERPISFSKMDDIKNRWETTSQQGRREVQREARKEEIAGIRSRLFMGKQGKMKEMYQQAVAGSERVTKINAAEEIQHSTHARSIKERFERGEPIAASDDETDGKPKPEKADEEVIAAGIGRKSRSLFLELDASAAKTGRPVTPVNPKTPADVPRRARDAFMGRQVSDDVVRSSDRTEEVQVETSDISNKFKFFESYKEPEKQRKQFRITPPRDGQVKMDSPDREIYRDPDVVRADDRVDEVVHTDTARKMLSIFRQMEENATKEELPEGPKPLKCFTPPPEDKFAKPTASDSEGEDEEEGEESEGEESTEERDPNYVRASDKVEDEFLKQAQNAARAKTLRAKFEHWEETDGKTTSHNVAEMELAQSAGDQSSIESASSLRARFESLGSQTNESPRTPKVKVHRFVEIQTTCTDVCESCEKKVYPLEKVETNNKIFHKQCFRCLQCNCVLRMDTFTLNNGKLYCIPHFKQLFITRGNYDEGFGVDPHKNKWATNSSTNSTASSPIAVSNGEL